jgi:large conductance mechanosensitive channel
VLKGFRDFILRGNVVDLAVAVMIGAAFNAIVTSLTKDILGQMIAAITGKKEFANIDVFLRGTPIHLGSFINATISFLITAAVVYFLIVLPMQYLLKKLSGPAPDPTTKPCPQCLSDIPLAATRCRFCTEPVS